MKPHPHRNAGNLSEAGRSPDPTRPPDERDLNTTGHSGPPVIPYWRYPSRSHHGQPWYPRGGRSHQPETAALSPGSLTRLSWVRVVALLAIIAIMVALAVKA